MIKRIVTAIVMATVLSSCAFNKPKVLVLYYTQFGSTAIISQEIEKLTGADRCFFDVEPEYLDGYDQTIERCLKERRENSFPELQRLYCDISQYDVIFLGYPIWFGTYATPVKSLLEKEKFEGKTIVPFCTFGSGGLQSSTEDLIKALPDAKVLDGFGVREARVYDSEVREELKRFLIENGWMDGEIEPLGEFSLPEEVSKDYLEIFNAACSKYKFPLGKPVSVCSRCLPNGLEYRYVTESKTFDGKDANFTIYVSVFDGKDPVFTQVVR